MMIKKIIVATAAATILCSVTGRSEAATVIVGSSTAASLTWDYVFFTHSGGALTIDVRAESWTGGPTGSGARDPVIVLFKDNSSPIGGLTGAFVGIYDDIGFFLGAGSASGGGFADGSVSSNDSFAKFVSLSAGPYVLGVGRAAGFIESNELRARVNSATGLTGDYQLTFSPSVTFGATPVPEPETYAMLLAGLGLLGFSTRRRNQKSGA
jgi:hypothetical protein